ncbi:hypothetical protein vseg_015507 [Gypsophila vaccaria]
MVVAAGSLQLSSFLGFCGNQDRSLQFKYVAGRGNRHCLGTNLSSCASRQDLWSHRLSTSFDRPVCSLPHRCSLMKCNSFLFFGQNVTIPTVNSATAALARSYNSVQCNPLLTKLVPPVCIVIFALWGLQPLMQLSRKIFVHKGENSWKKSTANYVMTSYLQPVLLWTAAILVCRNLDPIVMPTESSRLVKQRLLNFVKSLSTVLAFAFCLSSAIQQTQKYFMETNNPSDSRNMGFQFAGKAIYSAVWVAAVSLFMELLGFSTQKWLTAGGLGTVLLTLAGREIFTNFLSSIMIHATRPFVLNEWIQTKIDGYEVSGTVEHVGWWSPTIIRGEDREAVHIPNHKFTVNVVRNLTQKTHWRIKTHLAISHLDAGKISSIVADMRKVLAKNPQVEHKKLHRRVFLDNVDPENQALLILISCFVKTSHHEEYLCVKEAIMLDLLRVIKHHRARLATPIRTIQKFYNEPDLGNMSFSDSFFTRGGPAAKSPVLLIEPPYKINGEDKSKSQSVDDSKDKGLSTLDVIAKETTKPSYKTEVEAAEPSNLKISDEKKASVASKLNSKPDDKVNMGKSTSAPMSNLDNKSGDSLTKTESAQTKVNAETPKLASDSSKPAASAALEDNIVLGVALEGSKRTLPIEDDPASSPTSQEAKELAKQSNASPNSSGDKDEKDI